MKEALVGTALAGLAVAALPAPAAGQDARIVSAIPDEEIQVGIGKGTFLTLPRPITDIFVVTPGIADVEVRSNREVFIYGTGQGETSFYATDAGGNTVYEATIRVVRNIDQIREMMRLAMPGIDIDVQSVGGVTFLTGTVANPNEVEEAERLVQAFTGSEQIINRIQAATPRQVNLRVRFVEVSRELIKTLGVNLQAVDGGGDFLFGITRGRAASNGPGFVDGFYNVDPISGEVGYNEPVFQTGANSIYGIGSLFGLDFNLAIDALSQDGLASILAEPNLTAISGETASFKAGGEFPIAVTDGDGGVAIEFKEYGVILNFTPQVLSDDRIRLNVAPEVSELTDAGAIILDSISIPALAKRSASTTVELGSGQSFVLGGLVRNNLNTSVEKTPLLGDLPILGSLFRSQSFRRAETELMIVVTPYLVKPVSERIATPLDGMRAPDQAENWLLGQVAKPTDFEPVSAKAAPASSAQPGFSLE